MCNEMMNHLPILKFPQKNLLRIFLALILLSFSFSAYAIDTDVDGIDDTADNCPMVANSRQEDIDADGIGNLCDNCLLEANADQRDTNSDGFGNICDADLNNDGAVNFADLGIMRSVFFTADPDADLNGDGAVNFADLGLMRSFFFQAPGPLAAAQLVVLPIHFDFGDVFVGSSATAELTFDNDGNAPLNVNSMSVDGLFSVFAPTAFSIENEGQSRIVNIGFSPAGAGVFSQTLVIDSNTENPVEVTVIGRGIVPIESGDISAAPSVEFELVEVGSPSEQVLTITNTGAGPISVSSALTDNEAFSASAIAGESFPLIINPGKSRNLNVIFTPPSGTAGTLFSANLTLLNSDPDEGALVVLLQGSVISAQPVLPNNPVLEARVQVDLPDLINAENCSDVRGVVSFGPAATSSDVFQIVLSDTGIASASSVEFSLTNGSGVSSFSGISACGLGDGIIDVEVLVSVSGQQLPPFTGTPAVKNTTAFNPPVLAPVEPVSVQSAVEICGTSRVSTTVRIEGGVSSVSTRLDALTTDFCLNVTLRPNMNNTLIAMAIDDLSAAPKRIATAKQITVAHVDPSEIIIAQASSRPLTTPEVETLVANGVLNLDDPANFNVSMFTVVLSIGSFPVTISQPVAVPVRPGIVSYGAGNWTTDTAGGGSGGGGAGVSIPGNCTVGCSQVIVIPTPDGNAIPGVIIIDGRIKTLKEFFQITLLIQNISTGFTLNDVNAEIELPAGLTAVRVGLGIDVERVNLEGEVDRVELGSVGPNTDGVGQFIVRGDGIGMHDININFSGLLTGGAVVTPLPVTGTASTTVDVFGPPELDVVVRHPSQAGSADITVNEIYTLMVDVTNTSDRPALYTSLEMFIGGNVQLLDVNGNPNPVSAEVRSLGQIEPGETAVVSFTVQSLIEGEIIACQGLSAENITLTVDTGVEGVDCNIANTYPSNFAPLPDNVPPALLGISPLNGQADVPLTSSVIATLFPVSACLQASTWANVVTENIDELDPAKGLRVVSSDLLVVGTMYLEELDSLGKPLKHIPVELIQETSLVGGATIATMRPGLNTPYPLSQVFLKENTRYRATLKGRTQGVCNAVSGATMANDFVWTFSTEQTCNTLNMPQVSLVEPVDGAVDQALNQSMQLKFSDRMDLATLAFDATDLSASSFGVYAGAVEVAGEISGGTPVAGRVVFSDFNRLLSFIPTGNLPTGTSIHIRLMNTLRDICGNPLQTPDSGVKLFSFTTQPPDILAPVEPLVNPIVQLTNQLRILVSGSAEPLSTITVSGGADVKSTIANSAGRFNISVPLDTDQSSSLEVLSADASGNTSVSVVQDIEGSPLLVTNDSTAPTVVVLSPANGATGVARDAVIIVALDELHDPNTVNSFNVRVDNGTVEGALTLNGASGFIFTPNVPLEFNRTYTLQLRANGLADRAGNHLVSDFISTFKTENFPVPALSGLSSVDGVQATSVTLTISGSELASANAVISDNPGVSGNILSAITPLAATGATTLGIRTSGGEASLAFNVLQKPPVISAISPVSGAQGQNFNAVIQGSGLTGITGLSSSGWLAYYYA